uniref:Uncharacterized protein n=1 Tax=Nelumbo nucifera TaxID=4432 RepID=A0A822XKN2_NELNU|nr:TPA_asm: hypothetical protein HUJ06_021736 [Nelumbo nucifera]
MAVAVLVEAMDLTMAKTMELAVVVAMQVLLAGAMEVVVAAWRWWRLWRKWWWRLWEWWWRWRWWKWPLSVGVTSLERTSAISSVSAIFFVVLPEVGAHRGAHCGERERQRPVTSRTQIEASRLCKTSITHASTSPSNPTQRLETEVYIPTMPPLPQVDSPSDKFGGSSIEVRRRS